MRRDACLLSLPPPPLPSFFFLSMKRCEEEAEEGRRNMNVRRAAPRLHGHVNESRETRSQMRMKDESSSFSFLFFLIFYPEPSFKAVSFPASVGFKNGA